MAFRVLKSESKRGSAISLYRMLRSQRIHSVLSIVFSMMKLFLQFLFNFETHNGFSAYGMPCRSEGTVRPEYCNLARSARLKGFRCEFGIGQGLGWLIR